MSTCTYIKIRSDGYGTDWKTKCGHAVRCEAPMEVGFSFDPLPNEDGEFCRYCGKKIHIDGLPKDSSNSYPESESPFGCDCWTVYAGEVRDKYAEQPNPYWKFCPYCKKEKVK